MSISQHFGSVASAYARCRPTYPAELFEYLATLTTRHELAWDVGAGNGQATLPLAGIFRRVVATDQSAEQLAQAPQRGNIEYRPAPAQESGMADGSVDLVTVAQAAHWFDLPAFYAEVRRVLAPGGVVAIWTYGAPHIDDAEVEQIFQQWSSVVEPYWPADRRLVDEGYRTIPFPFAERTTPRLELAAQWSLPQLTGYASTWSSVGRYRSATSRDPVPDLQAALEAAWGNPETVRWVRWPLGMRVSA